MMLNIAMSITPFSRSSLSGPVCSTWVNIRCKLPRQVGQIWVQINRTGSATLPVGAATLSPSVSGSHERKGTQTLTFSLYPKVEPAPSTLQSMPGPIDSDKYPIAASLQRLRDGLLEASQAKPAYR